MRVGLSSAQASLLNGLNRAEQEIAATANRIASPNGGSDLADDIIQLTLSSLSYTANGKALKRVSRVADSILDILS
jgi:hypothetical protein